MRKIKIKKQEYALYKDDTFLALGTIDEIANQLNLKKSSIRWYTTKTAKTRKSHYICIKLEEENEE